MGAICGFSGPPNDRILKPMLAALAHRGTSTPIVHSSQHGTIAYFPRGDLAERRRLGTGLVHDERHALAISGLLTSDVEVANRLPRLLGEVTKQGTKGLESLSGDFVAAALVVQQQGRAVWHLIRDAAGARTVYHGVHHGRFLFASEPKGIWSVPGFPRRIRPASVAQYFAFSFVPGSGTMLEDIQELEPGHSLTYEDGRLRAHRYFCFEHGESERRDSPLDREEITKWASRTRHCIAQGVRDRLPGDEDPAVFLSGGLDSSLVASELATQSARPVHSFALHFGKRYPNELEFASAVARRCGTKHREIEIQPKEFLPDLRQMVWHLDDPIGDPITMPNMQLAREVGQHHRWVFNGEGGDPCFGGPKNIPMLIGHWYGVPQGARARERAYLSSYRRGYELIASLLTPELKREIDQSRDLESVLTPFFDTDAPRHFINKLFAINIRLKGAHLILPKVERMLGAAGIAPLAPLFTREIVNLSFEMPPLMKMASGDEKIALKRAYADALPSEVIRRPKSGMRVPVHFWFQGELRRFARHLLSRRRIQRAGIFNANLIQRLLRYNLETRNGRYGLRLWMLMTFELWRQIVVENESV